MDQIRIEWHHQQTDLGCKFVLITVGHLCKLEIAKPQVLILEALLLLYVVGLIVDLKSSLAGNGLSNMTETMTGC